MTAFHCKVGRKLAKSNCPKFVVLKAFFGSVIMIMNRKSSDKDKTQF